MPKTSRPSGNWGEDQKKKLRELVDANKINLARKDAAYLWEICKLPPFKPFISDASTGKTLQSNACARNSCALMQYLSLRELGGKVCV